MPGLKLLIPTSHGHAGGGQEALCSALPVTPDVKGEVKGRDVVTGLPKTLELSTNELVKAVDYELKQMVRAIKDVLQQTPPELASDIIDHGIVMTGGTSQLALLGIVTGKQIGRAHV